MAPSFHPFRRIRFAPWASRCSTTYPHRDTDTDTDTPHTYTHTHKHTHTYTQSQNHWGLGMQGTCHGQSSGYLVGIKARLRITDRVGARVSIKDSVGGPRCCLTMHHKRMELLGSQARHAASAINPEPSTRRVCKLARRPWGRTFVCPFSAAQCSGVSPHEFTMSGAAPCCSSHTTASNWPCARQIK
jgi:hypothetical protein